MDHDLGKLRFQKEKKGREQKKGEENGGRGRKERKKQREKRKREKRKVLNVSSVELQVGPGCLLRRDWGNVRVAQGGAGSVSGVRPPPAPRGWRAVWGRKGTRGDRDEREAHTKRPTFPIFPKKASLGRSTGQERSPPAGQTPKRQY